MIDNTRRNIVENQLKVHVALNVNDVEESVKFYRAMFGIEPVKHKPGYAKKVWITDPNGYRWEFFVVKVADTRPELSFTVTEPGLKQENRCCS